MRYHSRLRGALTAVDVDQAYLAELLNRGTTYVTRRMTGKAPWSQADMYQIMDIINASHDQLHLYFPPEGNAQKLKIMPHENTREHGYRIRVEPVCSDDRRRHA